MITNITMIIINATADPIIPPSPQPCSSFPDVLECPSTASIYQYTQLNVISS